MHLCNPPATIKGGSLVTFKTSPFENEIEKVSEINSFFVVVSFHRMTVFLSGYYYDVAFCLSDAFRGDPSGCGGNGRLVLSLADRRHRLLPLRLR